MCCTKRLPLTPLLVLCTRSCAKSCALGFVYTSCAHVLCRFQKCLRASNVLCAVLCGCCARLVRSVRRSVWVWDIFSSCLARSCAGVLGGTIPLKPPHNTHYLDKALCASCAPGTSAKKSWATLCGFFL